MKKAILILLFLICIYGLISKHKPKTDLTYVSSTPKINLEYDVNFKKIVNQINRSIIRFSVKALYLIMFVICFLSCPKF